MSEHLTLIVKKGAEEISRRELTEKRAVLAIGRNPDCDITLPDVSVSPRHAELILRFSELRIKNLCSINGTRVNGVRIQTKTRLQPGDEISIGSYSILVTMPGGAEAVTAAASGRKRLRLLLFASLILILAALLTLAVQHRRQVRVARTTAAENAAPPPSNDNTPPAFDAESAIGRAERAVINNDPVTAAMLFKQGMEQYSNDLRIVSMFNATQQPAQDRLSTQIQAAILANRLADARQQLSQLEYITANNTPAALQFRAWIDAEERFSDANRLYLNGDYFRANTILTNLTVLQDERRTRLLDRITPVLHDRQLLAQAEADMSANRYDNARATLTAINEARRLDPVQMKRVRTDLDLLNALETFETAVENTNAYQAILSGNHILQTENAPSNIVSDISAKFDLLRDVLAPREEGLRWKTADDLSKISRASNQVAEMTMRVAGAYDLTLLHFLRPNDYFQQQIAEQTNAIFNYLRDQYQQAYILESVGQTADALIHYQNIFNLSWDDGRYYPAARSKLNRAAQAQPPSGDSSRE